ncbi:hypothetical protein N9151_00100 [bacterium]|nr:hypothetical protein [bacterium]
MKITLDLPSVAAGGAVALVLGLVAGFSPQATQVPGATNVAPRQITGQFSPHPSDLVWLESYEASPLGYDSPVLTVPAGRILVLTGFSTESATNRASIWIDGVERGFYGSGGSGGQGSGFRNEAMSFSIGVPLAEGQTLQLRRSGYGYAWLHGYWADA